MVADAIKNPGETYLEVAERCLYSKFCTLISENRFEDAREVINLMQKLEII